VNTFIQLIPLLTACVELLANVVDLAANTMGFAESVTCLIIVLVVIWQANKQETK
jgi:hypothetical protein